MNLQKNAGEYVQGKGNDKLKEFGGFKTMMKEKKWMTH